MRLSTISEATLDDVKNRLPVFAKKYGEINPEILNTLLAADPTRGKYSEWLVRNYRKGFAHASVDGMRGLLDFFHRKKSKLPNQDINAYTPDDLARLANQEYSLTKSERKSARKGEMQLPPGAKHLGRHGNIDVVEITDSKAATMMCSGSKWCTANMDSAESSIRDGPLYMIFVDGQRAYLTEYSEFQVRDIFNNRVDLETALRVHEAVDSVTGDNMLGDPMYLFYMAQAAGESLPPKYEQVVLSDPQWAEEYENEGLA